MQSWTVDVRTAEGTADAYRPDAEHPALPPGRG
jgi:hypothetical protein